MTVNQISIFLENKYGKLSEILALLAERAHPHHRSHRSRHLRVWNPSYHRKRSPEGIQDIKRNNVSANLTDVLAIVTSSCAGSFANTLSYFTKAGISIEYMYCFSIREKRS